MGYRSEVAWVLRFKDTNQMRDYINLLRYKRDEHINTALEEIKQSTDPEPILFFSDDLLKWYDDYEDVRAHHFIMDHAYELYGDDVGWRFIRIGEESDDIEEKYDGNVDDMWDYIYVSRSINGNLPKGEPVIEDEKEEVK